jgi:cation:H+ antiporter
MRTLLPLVLAVSSTLPAFYLRLSASHLSAPLETAIYGVAILGAASMLTWAAELAQLEVSQALALALLALIAVLPEYAVDLFFAYTAAFQPEYAAYAAANMTGANRLLVGVGWPFVVLLHWWRMRKPVINLESGHRVELAFLTVASIYAFIIPFKASISVIDSLLLVGLFVWYAWRVANTHHVKPELVGPAARIGRLPRSPRRVATALLFGLSGAAILTSAEPFAESLIETGASLGVDKFLLVQWLAPLASETPEFIVAGLLTLRGHPAMGFGALISSKVNQWTLLIGTIPLAYSAGLGTVGEMPLDARQVEEVLLTASQSVFGIAVMVNLVIRVRGAVALLVLFLIQFFTSDLTVAGYSMHLIISIVYLIGAVALLVRDRAYLLPLLKRGLFSR